MPKPTAPKMIARPMLWPESCASRNRSTPVVPATKALTPSQSAIRMSPGLPASASRLSIESAEEALVTRLAVRERRARSGRIVRSRKGAWSSSSSRLRACIEPNWVSRAWTGSTGPWLAKPMKRSRIPRASMPPRMIGSVISDLDVYDASNGHKAHEHHHPGADEDDQTRGQTRDLRRLFEHRLHEARCQDHQDGDQTDGKARDDVTRHALLGRERLDLALDPDSLADGKGDGVENLGQVASDLVLDRDRGGHQFQVIGADTPDHVLEGGLKCDNEVDLTNDAAELRGDRWLSLANDHLDRLKERGAGPKSVGGEGDRVG